MSVLKRGISYFFRILSFFTYRLYQEWSLFWWALCYIIDVIHPPPPNQGPSLSDPTELPGGKPPTKQPPKDMPGTSWKPIHVCFSGCFNWMITSLYIGNGWNSRNFHPWKKSGCFGYQLYTSIHLCAIFEVLSRNALNKNHPRNSHAIQETF